MATQAQAELAVVKLGPRLKRGHALGVDVRKLPRRAGFGVVVFFESAPKPAWPDAVPVTIGAQVVQVPVKVVLTEPFKPDLFKPD
jgi:hypothetical protein